MLWILAGCLDYTIETAKEFNPDIDTGVEVVVFGNVIVASGAIGREPSASVLFAISVPEEDPEPRHSRGK